VNRGRLTPPGCAQAEYLDHLRHNLSRHVESFRKPRERGFTHHEVVAFAEPLARALIRSVEQKAGHGLARERSRLADHRLMWPISQNRMAGSFILHGRLVTVFLAVQPHPRSGRG
jgi:hypothetical protein